MRGLPLVALVALVACNSANPPAAPSGEKSSLAVSPASVVADGTSVATVVVTVRDAKGAPLAGRTVLLDATGSSNVIHQPPPTGLDGTATGTVASTRAESKTVSASTAAGAAQTALGTPAVVQFVAGPPSAAASSAKAAPATGIVADGTAAATIAIVVLDANANPVPGATARLSATGTGNVLAQPAPTGPDGKTSGTVASTVAEAKAVTVTLGDAAIGAPLPVTFVAGPVSSTVSTIAASPASVIADGTSVATVVVTLRDARSNPVAGKLVALSLPLGATAPEPAATAADGRASFSLTSTKAQDLTVGAIDQTDRATLAASAVVHFVAGAPSASASSVTATSATGIVADGAAVSTIAIVVRDANGNPISGATTRVSATGTGNVLTQPAPTGANGTTSATLASTVAEVKVVTVKLGDATSAAPLQITFVAGPVSSTASTIAASPASVTADGTTAATMVVTLRDSKGNPVAGKSVVLALPGRMPPPAPAATAADGRASFSLTSTRVQDLTVGAIDQTDRTTLAASAVVHFVAGPADAASSKVAAAPVYVQNDGVSTATVTVTLLDAKGNTCAGRRVGLGVNPGAGATVDGGDASTGQVALSAVTASDGTVTARLAATTAGVRTISAFDVTDGIMVAATAQVDFEPPPTVTSFSPTAGQIGSSVVVSGTGFDANAANDQVTINGVAATVTAASTSNLTVTVPATTSGPIAVTVHGLTGTSSASFTVQAGTPWIIAAPRSAVREADGTVDAIVVGASGMKLLHRRYAADGSGTFTESLIIGADSGREIRPNPTVAINSAGTIFVVYATTPHSSQRDNDALFLQSWTAAGGWSSPPLNLMTAGIIPQQSVELHQGFELAIDGSDRLHLAVAYYPYSGSGHLDYYQLDAAGARLVSSWPNLHQNWCGRPALLVDGDGVLQLVYDSYYSVDSGGGYSQAINYRSSSDGGKTWSAEQAIATRFAAADNGYGFLSIGTGASKVLYFSSRDTSGQAAVIANRGSGWVSEFTTNEAGIQHVNTRLVAVGGKPQLYWGGPTASGKSGPNVNQLRRVRQTTSGWGAIENLPDRSPYGVLDKYFSLAGGAWPMANASAASVDAVVSELDGQSPADYRIGYGRF